MEQLVFEFYSTTFKMTKEWITMDQLKRFLDSKRSLIIKENVQGVIERNVVSVADVERHALLELQGLKPKFIVPILSSPNLKKKVPMKINADGVPTAVTESESTKQVQKKVKPTFPAIAPMAGLQAISQVANLKGRTQVFCQVPIMMPCLY